jgi:hypothetical protein
VQDEGRGPLRVGGGEQHAHRPTLGDPEQGGALRPCRVHDRPQIVGPLVQRGDALDGSESPVPRLSHTIRREKEARRPKARTMVGISQ